MNSVSSWQEALVASWAQVWTAVLSSLPTIFGAIIIFALGLILAYWAKRLVSQGLHLVKFEKVSESLGIDQYLRKADIKTSLSELLSTLVEWIIVLVFFLAVVDVLGLNAVSLVLTQFVSYIPNILAAALIFGAGYFVAGLLDGVVRGALSSVDHKIAKPVGHATRWLVLVISFFAAIDQLQIANQLVTTFFQGLAYTIVLVLGLSIGLGAKDLVSKVLNDWYEKFSK